MVQSYLPKLVQLYLPITRMFILNVAGLPVLKEYSLAGELQAIHPLSPPSFDTEIGFYQSDPFASPLTDQMNGLALDPADPRDILYASFHSFDTRERSSYGLSTYRWIILRIDLDAKTIQEVPIAGKEHLELSCELIPQVKGDTLHVLMRDQDEALYLKRLVIGEVSGSGE
ncbi:hypothetical protein [Nitritalea halalkaliphila]|nr:hypothetical protein [Nitritalea halalkaliphila]